MTGGREEYFRKKQNQPEKTPCRSCSEGWFMFEEILKTFTQSFSVVVLETSEHLRNVRCAASGGRSPSAPSSKLWLRNVHSFSHQRLGLPWCHCGAELRGSDTSRHGPPATRDLSRRTAPVSGQAPPGAGPAPGSPPFVRLLQGAGGSRGAGGEQSLDPPDTLPLFLLLN